MPAKSNGNKSGSKEVGEAVSRSNVNKGKKVIDHPPIVQTENMGMYQQYLQIHAQKALMDGKTIFITMDPNIFGFTTEEVLGAEQIYEVINHDLLSASVICVYIRYFIN